MRLLQAKNPRNPAQTELLELFHDGYRAVLEFFDTIQECAASIYFTVLPLLPPKTQMARLFQHGSGRVVVMHGVHDRWGPSLRTIQTPNLPLSVAFSEDGDKLYSTHEDGIQIWEARTGELRLSLKTGNVHSIAVLQDGSVISVRIVDSRLDETMPRYFGLEAKLIVTSWDPETGVSKTVFMEEFKDIRYYPYPIVYSATNTSRPRSNEFVSITIPTLESAGVDYPTSFLTIVCDTFTWQIKHRFLQGYHHHSGNAGFFALSYDYFATDGKIINIESGTVRTRLKGCDVSRTISTVFSFDGRQFAVKTQDSIDVYDIASGAKSISYIYTTTPRPPMPNSNPSMAFSRDHRHLAAITSPTSITIWQVGRQRPAATFSGHSEDITAVSFSPSGQYLVSSSKDKMVKIWDLAVSQTHGSSQDIKDTHNITAIDFMPDGSHLACGTEDGTFLFCNPDTMVVTGSWRGSGDKSRILAIAFSPDGKWLATKSTEDVVNIWSVGTMRLTKTLQLLGFHMPASMSAISFSADVTRMVCTTPFGLTIWDTVTWEAIVRQDTSLNGFKAQSLALSTDGKYFAYCDFDGLAVDETFKYSPTNLISIGLEARQLIFSKDNQRIHSTAGTYDIAKKVRVDTRREPEKRLNALHFEDGWIIDADGEQVFRVPEGYWTGRSSFTTHGNTLAWCRPNGMILVMNIIAS
jgi:WD40 repeat protein